MRSHISPSLPLYEYSLDGSELLAFSTLWETLVSFLVHVGRSLIVTVVGLRVLVFVCTIGCIGRGFGRPPKRFRRDSK